MADHLLSSVPDIFASISSPFSAQPSSFSEHSKSAEEVQVPVTKTAPQLNLSSIFDGDDVEEDEDATVLQQDGEEHAFLLPGAKDTSLVMEPFPFLPKQNDDSPKNTNIFEPLDGVEAPALFGPKSTSNLEQASEHDSKKEPPSLFSALEKAEESSETFPFRPEKEDELSWNDVMDSHVPLPTPSPPVSYDSSGSVKMSGSIVKALRKDPLIGAVLGHFQILKKIGSGGFGSVYHAQQGTLGQSVAIKVLHAEQHDPVVVERFFREARALIKMQHTNIVRIIDFGQIEGEAFYLVMELLEGSVLRDHVRKGPRWAYPRVASFIEQMCSALAYIHQQRIYHRDLKPANIILISDSQGDEQIKLIDFGVASIAEEENALTQTGACLGSPSYMSPEQARGDTRLVDGRSDLYSLGIILFQILTGKLPFKAPNFAAILGKHLFAPPPRLSDIAPEQEWAPELEDFIQRILAKTPEERPSHADMFWFECRNALEKQQELLPLGEDEATQMVFVNLEEIAQQYEQSKETPYPINALSASSSISLENSSSSISANAYLSSHSAEIAPNQLQSKADPFELDGLEGAKIGMVPKKNPQMRTFVLGFFAVLVLSLGGWGAGSLLFSESTEQKKQQTMTAPKRQVSKIKLKKELPLIQPKRPTPILTPVLWRLKMLTVPKNVSVWENDKQIGMTPYELKRPPHSKGVIQLRKDGFLHFIVKWDLKALNHTTTFRLIPKKTVRHRARSRKKRGRTKDLYGVDDPI